jgi:hypothetical protein
MGRGVRLAHHRGLALQETAMWTTLFDRRRCVPATALPDADDDMPDDIGTTPSGWHESSWALAAGVEVIELPASDAERWFAACA